MKFLGSIFLLLLLAGTAVAQPGFDQVLAILESRCTVCHSGQGAPLGLRLSSYEGLMSGSSNGPVVLAGDPEGSELLRRLRGTSLPRMPLTGPPFLSGSEIESIAAWVAAGAPGPEHTEVAVADEAAPTGETEDTAPDEAAPSEEAHDTAAGEPATRPAEAAGTQAAAPPTYADVAPILLSRCAHCHSDGGSMGAAPEGLRLTSHDLVLQGGERVVVVPFAPLASELYRKILGHSLPRMPLDGPPYLSPEQIALIGEWIEQGARSAQGEPAPVPAGGEVRLRGTLTGRWELDGLDLLVGPSTRIEDEPGVGDYVEVRGVITPDGEMRVRRLRAR